jgi:hypothetical protein
VTRIRILSCPWLASRVESTPPVRFRRAFDRHRCSEEHLRRSHACSRPASALQRVPRRALSVTQSPTAPSGERSVDASSRSEEREREVSLRLTVGLGSSPQRTTLPWGFVPFDVCWTRAATHAGPTFPGSAAPSGFLNLLTPCSARAPTALFHAESVPGVPTFRGFPLPRAATTFAALCPSCRSPRRSASDFRGCLPAGGPFTPGRCYPGPDGRSSPGCSTHSRGSPRVSASHRCKASSHGLFTTLDHSIVVTALQSFKELKGKKNVFRYSPPSSG